MIETITAPVEEVVEIPLGERILDANDRQAAENRALLARHAVTALDIMGAIGSGKTTLIAGLVARLKAVRRIAVINGDPVTADDVLPIAAHGVPVIQIAADACHLDADLVSRGLAKLPLAALDLLLIENVGNLICPGNFALGSKARIVVVSVTEGPWMVRKHPHMFLGAGLVVINKCDLAPAMGLAPAPLVRDVQTLKPDLPVLVTSARTGEGMAELARAIERL